MQFAAAATVMLLLQHVANQCESNDIASACCNQCESMIATVTMATAKIK
jgi:hypothetical protein